MGIPLHDPHNTSFISSLKSQGLIDKSIISFNLGHHNYEGEKEQLSYVTIGSIDES